MPTLSCFFPMGLLATLFRDGVKSGVRRLLIDYPYDHRAAGEVLGTRAALASQELSPSPGESPAHTVAGASTSPLPDLQPSRPPQELDQPCGARRQSFCSLPVR